MIQKYRECERKVLWNCRREISDDFFLGAIFSLDVENAGICRCTGSTDTALYFHNFKYVFISHSK